MMLVPYDHGIISMKLVEKLSSCLETNMLPDLILPLMEDKVDLTSILCNMTRRTNVVDNRNNRVALFDGIEEGGIRAQSLYSSSHEIDEHDNEQAMDGLQDRVNLLKRLSGDIQEEVDSHNRMLDRMGNDMDSSRGILSGTMDKFKMVC
ncbi:bet1-like SNARE 1-1 isoform X1 [Arachis duranensis]|uniref:BET1-like SNARE 1-1 isoform X1 n=1 Tax=Arachis duranensis TaxID=130453 RepID=A0A6P4DKA7_ARADU|nr:bet1-like SNARE 1-1 isoform X1 [Arachis duranensis]